MSEAKLKRCPFCGGEAEFYRTPVKTNGGWCDSDCIRYKDCRYCEHDCEDRENEVAIRQEIIGEVNRI